MIVQEPDGRVELLEGNFDSSNTTAGEVYFLGLGFKTAVAALVGSIAKEDARFASISKFVGGIRAKKWKT